MGWFHQPSKKYRRGSPPFWDGEIPGRQHMGTRVCMMCRARSSSTSPRSGRSMSFRATAMDSALLPGGLRPSDRRRKRSTISCRLRTVFFSDEQRGTKKKGITTRRERDNMHRNFFLRPKPSEKILTNLEGGACGVRGKTARTRTLVGLGLAAALLHPGGIDGVCHVLCAGEHPAIPQEIVLFFSEGVTVHCHPSERISALLSA